MLLQAKAASTPAGFSSAANVPSVSATAVLTDYDVANFTSVQTKVCSISLEEWLAFETTLYLIQLCHVAV